MSDDLPDGPVEAVAACCVTGARVMHGTWPDGDTGVLIHTTHPYDPLDAQIATETGQLPSDE